MYFCNMRHDGHKHCLSTQRCEQCKLASKLCVLQGIFFKQSIDPHIQTHSRTHTKTHKHKDTQTQRHTVKHLDTHDHKYAQYINHFM